ncbi:MAG: acido-empty-quinoprotein group A [Acidobacteriota bacterium]|nr:acido-empty-quinoprotein group A [Acidobacteriota bacterium]
MNIRNVILSAVLTGGMACSQMLDPAKLLQPPTDTWPTYNGDYSARRYSTLKQINSSNVHTLSLGWVTRFANGPGVTIKSTPLLVNGTLYFTSPNNVWAADALTGRQLWHYQYPPNTGSTIGNRGVGIYGNWLFFESPDSNLVSLDAKTGKERWKVQIVDPKLDYTSTVAPIIVGNHVILGIGGDHMDNPGFIESRDPETGALQWKAFTTPRKGEKELETWPDEYASVHGTGQTWIPGSYDPELGLYYVGTGNPNPVLAEQSRKGDNLYTCTILALDVNTGKKVWYYQVSPHEVHDWDASEAPVLIDGTIDGKPRKLLAQASRNGYYFLLDRVTGEHIVTKPFIDTLNWSKGLNAKGQPIPDPAKFPRPDGTLVSPASNGATNWPAPSFDPETGLLYVGANKSFSMFYVTDTDDHPEGWGGLDTAAGSAGAALVAIDYKTGDIKWQHEWPAGGGPSHCLTTAGKLLFTHNSNNLIAFDPANGKILWHTNLTGPVTAGIITYELDGKQYLLAASGDTLYAFTVNQPVK